MAIYSDGLIKELKVPIVRMKLKLGGAQLNFLKLYKSFRKFNCAPRGFQIFKITMHQFLNCV